MSKADELAEVARRLPPDALDELLDLARRWERERPSRTPYVPVRLGGLWREVSLDDDACDSARRETWASLGRMP